MEEILQKIFTVLKRLGDELDRRSRMYKKYKKSALVKGVMDWVLLSRESKIKIIEEIKNKSIKENSHIFQSCFVNKSSEFYADRIDALLTYADRKKLKLRVIWEGITVMVICIALVEEIKSLNSTTRESLLPSLKERLRKEEKFGIPFEKCLEEVLNIYEKLNS